MHEAESIRALNDRYWHGDTLSAQAASMRPPPPHTPTEFARLPPDPPKRMNGQPAPGMLARMTVERGIQSQIGDATGEFRRVFHEQAARLLASGALPIPPGHPLYTRRASIAALEAERDGLLKENADLKMRLEGKGVGLADGAIHTPHDARQQDMA